LNLIYLAPTIGSKFGLTPTIELNWNSINFVPTVGLTPTIELNWNSIYFDSSNRVNAWDTALDPNFGVKWFI
jgi:hypothetical protein